MVDFLPVNVMQHALARAKNTQHVNIKENAFVEMAIMPSMDQAINVHLVIATM